MLKQVGTSSIGNAFVVTSYGVYHGTTKGIGYGRVRDENNAQTIAF